MADPTLVVQVLQNVDPYASGAAAAENADLRGKFGDDPARLALKLKEADLSSGAGTPAVRLRRVLSGHTVAPGDSELSQLLAAQKQIDEKILRGKITDRDLIGGHSNQIMSEPQTHMRRPENPNGLPTASGGAVLLNANGTLGVKFRKLLAPGDLAYAQKVATAAADSPVVLANKYVTDAEAGIQAALNIDLAAKEFTVNTKLFKEGDGGWDFAKKTQGAKQAAAGKAQMVAAPEIAAFRSSLSAIVPLAGTVVSTGGDARSWGEFDTALQTLLERAANIVKLAQACLDGAEKEALSNGAADLRRQCQESGPSFTIAKISTLAPPTMTEDEILKIGDAVSATESLTLRYEPPGVADSDKNKPPDGAQVDTKPTALVPRDGKQILWITMKSGVPFTKTPVKRAHGGGTLISSYPTSLQAPEPPKDYPDKDTDRFTAIASVPD